METMTVNPTLTTPMMTANHGVSGITQPAHTPQPKVSTQDSTIDTKMYDQTNRQNSRFNENQKEVLKKSTEDFNKISDDLNLDVKFAYDDKIDQVYLNIVDKNTGEVIRKLPSEEAMKISESMKDLVGALFDKKG